MPIPHRKTGDLRIGRYSMPGARYFVTACTASRRPVFIEASSAATAHKLLLRLVTDRDVRWLVASIMPDHIHLLFELGERLSLEQCLAKTKGLISRALSPGGSIWQENAFEHRLRPHEHSESYAFYIFMNPYRAGLVPITESWPWWICTDAKGFRFLEALDKTGAPPLEWLDRDETAGGTLVVGAL
jgi:REP element-mobilizing transposase RayT